ncbi:MAG: hypothetical protein ACRC7O_04515 [Fimbriiglobus sp.]
MGDTVLIVITALAAGLAGIILVTSTGVKALVETYFEQRKKRMIARDYSRGLENIAEFSAIIQQVKNMECVDRILVFNGQDSGGLPKPGKPYTVRAFIGWSSKIGESVLDLYNYDLQIDKHYALMLTDLVDHGSVVNTPADMPDDAFLKACYLDEGVAQSLLYFIRCDGAQLTFLSVASYRRVFTPGERVRVDLLVGRLRAIVARN